MSYWAILSGVEGNLAAYEAVLADIKQRAVEEIYILGDLVGPHPECEKLVQRVQNPRQGELQPQVCKGWWEEQCLILHGVGATGDVSELTHKYGAEVIELLWKSVSRQTVEWLRQLDFGFHDLDCLLVHGSTLGVDDELSPETPAPQMLDRLLRGEANTLFCGRSGLAFEYQVQSGSITASVTTLDEQKSPCAIAAQPRQVIGVGNVGRVPKIAIYTLFEPNTNSVEFKTVNYKVKRSD
ncbi:metallophosphoesterase family protein [Gloeocapsopsis dulcis]|uniref:Metallophosphatase n=1 Tax=Gloeocapsopsis dulcis AAB1 = 1H9 TaxID=1433147 RepID=A0A6N8FUT7_9CHRO|nr:metallophosphoesterase family protein [Gloeocapsopsis dulcis]MUL36873.1 metallophosphatase [Gloeocapsopsis dulcis AAB1 = 1H9]WNN88517.1 metallophosphoesterase family protein [Gloeocapsopsis dulcis]